MFNFEMTLERIDPHPKLVALTTPLLLA